MKITLSKIWACILSFVYDGEVYFHHINQNGYWEFEIYYYSNYFKVSVFKTKGLR